MKRYCIQSNGDFVIRSHQYPTKTKEEAEVFIEKHHAWVDKTYFHKGLAESEKNRMSVRVYRGTRKQHINGVTKFLNGDVA